MECHYIGTSQLVLLMDCHEGIASSFDDAMSPGISQMLLLMGYHKGYCNECVDGILLERYPRAGFVGGLS